MDHKHSTRDFIWMSHKAVVLRKGLLTIESRALFIYLVHIALTWYIYINNSDAKEGGTLGVYHYYSMGEVAGLPIKAAMCSRLCALSRNWR